MEWHKLGLGLLICLLAVAREVGGEGGVSEGDDFLLRRGAEGKGDKDALPRWFDDETMRVVGPKDMFYMGYCAFIPQSPATNYSAAEDESISLSRRINAGYKLPNTYRPGEWAPLRRFFPPPSQQVDENGVLQGMRNERQPVSWLTFFKYAFGPLGRLPTLGDHMGEDPSERKGGLNKMISPIAITRAVSWVALSFLPPNWVQYPYLPWVPWKPWTLVISSLPEGKTYSLNDYLHHNDLRPQPSQIHPWFKSKPKAVWVRVPQDRDRDIASEWPIYSTKIRRIQRAYKQKETLLVLKGRAEVSCGGMQPVELEVDALATIPAGAECEWEVKEAMMMHYMFH